MASETTPDKCYNSLPWGPTPQSFFAWSLDSGQGPGFFLPTRATEALLLSQGPRHSEARMSWTCCTWPSSQDENSAGPLVWGPAPLTLSSGSHSYFARTWALCPSQLWALLSHPGPSLSKTQMSGSLNTVLGPQSEDPGCQGTPPLYSGPSLRPGVRTRPPCTRTPSLRPGVRNSACTRTLAETLCQEVKPCLLHITSLRVSQDRQQDGLF